MVCRALYCFTVIYSALCRVIVLFSGSTLPGFSVFIAVLVSSFKADHTPYSVLARSFAQCVVSLFLSVS